MFCNQCGEQIEEDSIFCQFCGNKIQDIRPETQSENTSKTKNVTRQPVNEDAVDLLWSKFADVYDNKNNEQNKFDEISSEYIWELIERLYTNAFESLIGDKKDELNTRPYNEIEALKNLYMFSVLGGYKFWIAEALLKNKPLGKFKSFDIDDFVEEWKSNDFEKEMKEISEEMGVCMTMYLDHRITIFLDAAPSAKELPNSFIEELRNTITFQIINGYMAGVVEDKFRK